MPTSELEVYMRCRLHWQALSRCVPNTRAHSSRLAVRPMAFPLPERALVILKYWLGDSILSEDWDFRPDKNNVWFGSALDAEIKVRR